jgi:hypothetical protein
MEKLHELKYFVKTKKIEQKDKYQEFRLLYHFFIKINVYPV